MLKKIVWPLLLMVSISFAIVFAVGFIISINISQGKESSNMEEEIEDQDEIVEVEEKNTDLLSDILILGDSIGFGIGDEENLGIGERYLNLLNKDQKTGLDITNISVPGYESEQLVDLIRRGEDKNLIENASLIIISIGGNDLNRLEYEDDIRLNVVFKQAIRKYKENLDFITREIRSVNPHVQLALIGLYNPYAKDQAEKNRLLLEWNYETSLILDSDSKFAYIGTYDQFKYHLDEYLSPDAFHPSAAGYQFIAEELYRILN